MGERRPTLRLKTDDLVPQDEDRMIDMHVFDVLLPCRRYEVDYKVAVLGQVSPTLEFLLRLLKAADGISENDARLFFGYNRVEMEFVLSEGVNPGYIERRADRLWLTAAGELLFSYTEDGPVIYSVENRRKAFGFDQLSIAPQSHLAMDQFEMGLPDLSLDPPKGAGSASKVVEERFHYFFRELGDREDRERAQRRDLYSIGNVVPGDRFQVPLRIKVKAQASSPSIVEGDLSEWRPEAEMTDRPEVEQAVGRFLADLRQLKNDNEDSQGYRLLTELAPEFFKDFTIAAGLSVSRYWREAVARAGEPRADRQTVPVVGSLFTQPNIERLLRVMEYGLRESAPPSIVLSVPPMTKFWGASTLLRDLNSVIRLKLRGADSDDFAEPEAYCVVTGKIPRYLPPAFDRVTAIEFCGLPTGFELYLIPGVAAVAMVHAPVGAASGVPAPMGFASFDPAVLKRVGDLLLDNVTRYVVDLPSRSIIEDAIIARQRVGGE